MNTRGIRTNAQAAQAKSGDSTRGSVARLARGAALFAAATALLAGAAGCSGAEPVEADEFATRTGDLAADQWKNWSAGLFADTDLMSDPALCNVGNSLAFFLVAQNTDSLYYLRSFGRFPNPSWKRFGARILFDSAPTCTSQTLLPSTDDKFILAGRSTDGKIYALEGVQPAVTGPTPANPDWTGGWMPVSNTVYAGNDGKPALSSDGSRIVLAFEKNRTVGGSTISNVLVHTQTLPYASNKWNATPIMSPDIPVRVSGIPAITYMSGTTNEFVIMVRGSSSSGPLYWIYFNGTTFEGSWANVPIGEVSSDPSLEYHHAQGALTLYFRRRNEIMQTSVPTPDWIGGYPIEAITKHENEVFSGSPRAMTPAGIEGTRSVIVRGYNDSVSSNLNRHILRTESIGDAAPDL
ncbi:MAG TPA: hypothetical protein VMG12_27930 [Polyangiaceae bacterium]|nr:hypothetical protein [Polyangiaceae bacterium]